MAKPQPAQVFNPPNTLKQRVGGALPRLDADAIARAEEALKSLASQFDDWMDEELSKLEAAWTAASKEGLEGEVGTALFRAAHDVKGLGTTYEFPLVTRLAAPLCRLLETPELRAVARLDLAGALVNAVRVAIRDRVRTDDDPVGRALAQESEAIVDRVLRAAEG
jgi:chemotaxis protein histidine kinase CheA